jgi:hypothetical protein
MKRLLGLIFTLIFVVNLSGFYGQAFAQGVGSSGGFLDIANEAIKDAVKEADRQTGNVSDVSGTCAKILAESKSKNPDTTRQCTASNLDTRGGGNDEIVVILGESISGGSQKYSCGQVVNCLREKYKASKLTEGFVTCELQRDYNQCIVSGKDGLSLLSNYASQVYNWIAGIVGSICILVIIISGIQISIGGLSQEEVSSAKDRVIRALAGLVVLFLSAFILYTINPFFFT